MPLHHIIETESPDEVLPSQVREREGVSPRISAAEMFAHVPEVAAASAELQEMIDISALPEAVAAARRRLNDAVAHAQTVAARERAAKLKQAENARLHAESKRKKDERDRRMADDAPTVTLVFNGIRVVAKPQFAMDPATRGSVSYGITQIYRLIDREFWKPRPAEVIATECREILRIAIRIGAATVEVIA